jgi:hypothetical protein
LQLLIGQQVIDQMDSLIPNLGRVLFDAVTSPFREINASPRRDG